MCDDAWDLAADCSLKECPTGHAWTSKAHGVDIAHTNLRRDAKYNVYAGNKTSRADQGGVTARKDANQVGSTQTTSAATVRSAAPAPAPNDTPLALLTSSPPPAAHPGRFTFAPRSAACRSPSAPTAASATAGWANVTARRASPA